MNASEHHVKPQPRSVHGSLTNTLSTLKSEHRIDTVTPHALIIYLKTKELLKE